MPSTSPISKYCAVSYSATHTDGTPSYVASTTGTPVCGIAQEDAASGDTIDIWGPGSIVSNPSWNLTGGVYAAVTNGTGVVGLWTTAIVNLNVVGWVIDATTICVMPQPVIVDANAGTAIMVGTGGKLTT